MEAQGMIERVALAIRDKLAEGVDGSYGYCNQTVDENGNPGHEFLVDGRIDIRLLAIAAVKAMRTPSKAMLDAVEAEEEKRGYVAAAYESMDVETAWPIMIDAALAEDTACPASSKSRTGHRAD